jgi:hypothetical protein
MPRNRNPYALLVRMQIRTTTIESSMEISQKPKDRTAMLSSDNASGTQDTIVHPYSSQHYSQ